LAEIAPGNFRGILLRRTPAKSVVFFAGCVGAGRLRRFIGNFR
jgi:hypothetical protein